MILWLLALAALIATLIFIERRFTRGTSFEKPYERLTMALVVGCVLAMFSVAWWEYCWLIVDGRRGVAVVTEEHSHGIVDYEYVVKGVQYTGRSQRNWDEEKYRNVGVGQKSIVFFSASHPWLSSLETPFCPSAPLVLFSACLLFYEIKYVCGVIRDVPFWVGKIRRRHGAPLGHETTEGERRHGRTMPPPLE
jgi:hypothetical protein